MAYSCIELMGFRSYRLLPLTCISTGEKRQRSATIGQIKVEGRRYERENEDCNLTRYASPTMCIMI